jgi:hypothetical protein
MERWHKAEHDAVKRVLFRTLSAFISEIAQGGCPMTARNSAQNCRPGRGFGWSPARRAAAQLVAEGEKTLEEVAKTVKISLRQLLTWRQHPEFVAEVAAIEQHIGGVARRYALGQIARRVKAMNDRWLAMQRLIAARAKEHKKVPGGKTGLLVRRVKMLGSGNTAQVVEEYEFDAALPKAMLDLEKEAARLFAQVEDEVEAPEFRYPPLEEIVAALQRDDKRREKEWRERYERERRVSEQSALAKGPTPGAEGPIT